MAHEHAHAGPQADYEHTPAGATYEHTDAHTGPILKFMFWLTVFVVLSHLLVVLLYKIYIHGADARQVRNYPLAATSGPRVPPEPRLQQFPRYDITKFRVAEETLLTTYGWVDKDAGTVHIPVSEAMARVLERGLPVRQEATHESPGAMPSDASSGRVLEKRQQ